MTHLKCIKAFPSLMRGPITAIAASLTLLTGCLELESGSSNLTVTAPKLGRVSTVEPGRPPLPPAPIPSPTPAPSPTPIPSPIPSPTPSPTPAPVNRAPIANAGMDSIVQDPGTSVSLSGTASDPDNNAMTYQWSVVSGSGAVFSAATSLNTQVTNLAIGSTYIFRLTARDSGGLTGSDDVQVIVNRKPTVSAGVDQTITLPTNSVSLAGTDSDADGNIASRVWNFVSGPGSPTFSSQLVANPQVNGLVQGTYVFRYTATDNRNLSASDDMMVTVNPAPQPTPSPGSQACIASTTTGSMSVNYYTATGTDARSGTGGFFGQPFNVTDPIMRTDGPYSYVEMLPPGYDQNPNQSWPVIIFMHGIGERGGGSLREILDIARNFGPSHRAYNGRPFPAIILVPQCPGNEDWSYSGASATKLNQLLDVVIAKRRVDTQRIYVTGLSLGGGAAWSLAADYAPRVAAVVPVCAAQASSNSRAQALMTNNVAVWAFHAVNDNVVGAGNTDSWFASFASILGSSSAINTYPGTANTFTAHHRPDLRAFEWTGGSTVDVANKALHNPQIHYTRYNSGQHFIWNTTYANEGVYDWLFCQKK